MSESLRGENSIEEILSLLLVGRILSSFLSMVKIFSSALSNISSATSFLPGSLFSLPSSMTVFNEGADFWEVNLDLDLVLDDVFAEDVCVACLCLKATLVTQLLWAEIL